MLDYILGGCLTLLSEQSLAYAKKLVDGSEARLRSQRGEECAGARGLKPGRSMAAKVDAPGRQEKKPLGRPQNVVKLMGSRGPRYLRTQLFIFSLGEKGCYHY